MNLVTAKSDLINLSFFLWVVVVVVVEQLHVSMNETNIIRSFKTMSVLCLPEHIIYFLCCSINFS